MTEALEDLVERTNGLARAEEPGPAGNPRRFDYNRGNISTRRYLLQPLEATTDPFKGVSPLPEGLPEDPDVFSVALSQSIEIWRADGLRLVWLKVPVSKAALVPVAVDRGFVFHHAEEDYVQLSLKLVEDAFVPIHATHYIGVGGVVLNEAKELLVVSERYRSRGRGPGYKLPGGALQPGEHLAEAAMREVLEETGVRTRFESLACFRHWHGYRFGKSDIYFVCRLSPLSMEITMQESEIAECLWMPVADFLGDDEISPFNKRIVGAALNHPGIVPSVVEGYGDPDRYEFFMPDGQHPL